MLLTNTKMHEYIDSLSQCLDCTGILGYAIARNYRKLQEEAADYLQMYNNAIMKFGEETTLPDGSKTYTLNIQSEQYAKFIAEIEPLSTVEHNVAIMCVPYKEAINKLSAKQILSLDFMLRDQSSIVDL